METEYQSRRFLHPAAPEYRDYMDQAKESGWYGYVIFGEDTLAIIDSFRSLKVDTPHAETPYDPASDKWLTKSRQMLSHSWENSNTRSYVDAFLRESKDAGIIEESITGESITHTDIISNTTLEQMLRRHVEQFREKQKKIKPKLESIRASFMEGLLEDIQQGKLPIAVEYAQNTIQNTHMFLVDKLSGLLNANEEGFVHSDSSQHDLTIYLSEYLANEDNEDELESVIIHEFFHVLAGRTILVTEATDTEDEDNTIFFDRMYPLRMGLRTYPWIHEDATEKYANFDEAMTEILTHDYLFRREKYGRGFSYRLERDQFYTVCIKIADTLTRTTGSYYDYLGIKKLFVKIYFEHYDPSLAPRERLAAWRQLKALLKSVNLLHYLSEQSRDIE